MNLYEILNIPENIIIEEGNNINYFLESPSLDNINHAITIVNKFHSYFHFEQSFAYLLCAYIYKLHKLDSLKASYIEKAIFQDHTNSQALAFDDLSLQEILRYDRCIKYEKNFLDFAIGDHIILPEIELLDKALALAFRGEYKDASAIGIDYKSHRSKILEALIYIGAEDIDNALSNILDCINSIEFSHKQYHQYASQIYKKGLHYLNLKDH
ncbi:MAG UNVERIFIED_CONTAM: hypothetical protein LVQ98_04255 [Rickettsiaceae bacterium]|jgi:hypothetical protein